MMPNTADRSHLRNRGEAIGFVNFRRARRWFRDHRQAGIAVNRLRHT